MTTLGYSTATQVGQLLLRHHYAALPRDRVLPLADVEFHAFSQNGEDGILLYVFALLGATTRSAIELGAGDGIECNSANLLVNHGWHGLLVDGNPYALSRGRRFYAQCPTTWLHPPQLVPAWITADNVNDLVRGRAVAGEVDLLSIDLDGNDYWIWRALDGIRPRVVVLEFNAMCGPERSVSVPYDPSFRLAIATAPLYFGASLMAFVHLAHDKGYRLIGVQSCGYNAFFLRDDVGEDLFPERTPAECYETTAPIRGWDERWFRAASPVARRWQEV